MIHIDKTRNSMVVWCDTCPGLTEVFSTLDSALESARDHEQRAHPGKQQIGARILARRRRAAQTAAEHARLHATQMTQQIHGECGGGAQ